MKSKTQNFQFKTNINCSGCVSAVKPYLDNLEGIEDWSVDVASKEKTLSVRSAGIGKEQITEAVQKAGFSINQ